MKVELVYFYPFEVSSKRPRIMAYADVRLDGKILIRGIRLYEAKNGKLKSDLKDFSASIKYYVEGKDGEAVELIVDKGVAKSAGKANSHSYDFELWASPENWKKASHWRNGATCRHANQKVKV